MEDCVKGILCILVHVLLLVPMGNGFLENLCVFGRKISAIYMNEICLTYKHNACLFCKTPYHHHNQQHSHVSVGPAICLTAIYTISVPLPTAPFSVLSISQAPKEQRVESDFISLNT